MYPTTLDVEANDEVYEELATSLWQAWRPHRPMTTEERARMLEVYARYLNEALERGHIDRSDARNLYAFYLEQLVKVQLEGAVAQVVDSLAPQKRKTGFFAGLAMRLSRAKVAL